PASTPWSVSRWPRPNVTERCRLQRVGKTPTARFHPSNHPFPFRPRMVSVRDLGTTGDTGRMDLVGSRSGGPTRVTVPQRPRPRDAVAAGLSAERVGPRQRANRVLAPGAMIGTFRITA